MLLHVCVGGVKGWPFHEQKKKMPEVIKNTHVKRLVN